MTTGEHENEQSKNGVNDRELPARLLEIVRQLAEELDPQHNITREINLDSDLDRDLGLDSLGRAELLIRIGKTFKVKLSDNLLVEANSPRILLDALRIAGPVVTGVFDQAGISKPDLPRIEAPSSVETLVDILEFHTRTHPERPHLRLLTGDDQEEQLSYSDLHNAALRISHGLGQRGIVQGDRVAIMLATDVTFFVAFFGVLYAGGVPVPMYPPFRRSQIEEHLRRQAGILKNADINILIVSEDMRKVGSLLFGLAENLRHIETVAVLSSEGVADAPVRTGPETTALIQYTSGSTGDPKGVVLTHTNLLANIRSMGEALEINSSDIFISWLPLYHDMGLIGAWLGPLYYGFLTVIMSPLTFLADPSRWLRTISRYQATLSAAPNFAFELCCKNIRDEDLTGINLGSLRMVLNGAEPVSALTIKRFTEKFAPCGFLPEMMWPVYGMAENSVGLAFPPIGRKPLIEKIERSPLTRDGIAKPASGEDDTALTFVACGQPIPRHEIRIIDDAGHEVADRHEGQLQFRGPSATAGYFRNDEKNRGLFSGNWLESGDRAYLANGDVFITGRIKDMIIKAGRNIYPHEIEELVGQIEGVRKGCVAAVASTDQQTGTERLVLIVETRLENDDVKNQLRQRIIEACTITLDLPPDMVELVPPHAVLKTSSGKIRRSATRELFESGILTGHEKGLWLQILALAFSGMASRMHRLRRRIVETFYAGYWWTILVLIAVFAWLLVMVLQRRVWRHWVVHNFAKLFLWLTGTVPQVTIQKPVPKRGALLVANHSSYLDSLVILAIIPGHLTFVAKQELSHQWVAGPFLRRLGAVFVHRTIARDGVEDTAHELKVARSGERIISFPEGTMGRMPGLHPFRLGTFAVATQSGLPVIPVTLRGTRSVLRSGQWFPRRGRIEAVIGTPIQPEGSDFKAAINLRNRARAVILKQCGEPDYSHERLEISPPT